MNCRSRKKRPGLFKSCPGRHMPPSSKWKGYPLPKRRARVQIPQGAPQKTVRNFFTGKSEASCGRVQTTKENREDIINMQTKQNKLSVCYPLHSAIYIIWPGSSIGRAPDCLSGGCGFKSHQGRHMLPSSKGRISDLQSEAAGSSPAGSST